MNVHAILAVSAGAALAAQAGMNARLGRLLGDAAHATLVAFGVGVAFLVTVLAIAGRLPNAAAARTVPAYLWFAGGLLGAAAIVSLYWLMPRMGIGATTSLALGGQLVFALVAGHFGWFGLPSSPMTSTRALGALTLLVGLILINRT